MKVMMEKVARVMAADNRRPKKMTIRHRELNIT
jgi:hypothetical protein